ncbi:hypothetical protein [Pengzhenrongella sicca]|uniref:Uncharacterized protein n=1 Tax=Pengzhenrongella sicca TaxID=2819238 RepID=A0A8A4ZCF2_9MICO|nr:hypothetical protein [Pengzhenrongella sicca]QTE28553.1 hypothetical protein J4E96_14430 [Pengzhenrongella sicca]
MISARQAIAPVRTYLCEVRTDVAVLAQLVRDDARIELRATARQAAALAQTRWIRAYDSGAVTVQHALVRAHVAKMRSRAAVVRRVLPLTFAVLAATSFVADWYYGRIVIRTLGYSGPTAWAYLAPFAAITLACSLPIVVIVLSIGTLPIRATHPAMRGVIVYCPSLVLAFAGAWYILPNWPGGYFGSGLAWVLAWLSIIIVLFVYTFLYRRRASLDPRHSFIRALGNLLTTAIFDDPETTTHFTSVKGLAAAATQERHFSDGIRPTLARWACGDTRRTALARSISDTADEIATGYPALGWKQAPEIRSQLTSDARRIAAGLHTLAKATLLGGPRDETVVGALADGLVAASQGRWSALSLHEPLPRAPRVIQEVLRRTSAIAALVLLGAYGAPLLSSPLDDQVRNLLFGTALLAVVTPRKAVEDAFSQARDFLPGGNSRD